MEKIRAIDVDKYDITYHVLEISCPKCGAIEEIHLPEDELFFDKVIKCHKCRHEYKGEYN
jgi:hypothetical protein